jgi:hypothetical protein
MMSELEWFTPTSAEAFFASVSDPPAGASRWRWARELARAEAWARAAGASFEWHPDPDPTHNEPRARQVWECFAILANGTVAASIAAIRDPTPEQRRLVEAQVALEAMVAWRP